MTYARVRWGIIGCGAVTEVKSGPAFQKVPDSSLVAVMRRDGEKARDYAQRHAVPRWYDDAAALVADPDVDAVYVATPPSSHRDYALMAIAAGKPVYVEKPMAIDRTECDAIIDAGRAAGVPVFVAYYRRALPRFRRIAGLLREGAIGTPRLVNVVLHHPLEARYRDPENLPWTVRPEISGGGVFVDIGCHTLDILDFLLGPIVDARGMATNQANAYAAEDTVAMAFRFDSGVLGTGVWNFCADRREDRVEIVGDRGRLIFATFGDGPVVLESDGRREDIHVDNPEHIQQPLIASIVAELTGKGVCPSTAESGARTSWVMDQVLRPARG
ncbi:MAG: Gfo/Idh/MocA family oxidoreductase [Luteibacter sp.]|uniref:Gfo/Idh/MocA family protein n=1 Tax=Luteibacter sp. TaxID=1886636 RepID=UPI002807EA85|nr:Gfo/Idh/MocA family oxidoreductase [Luteibacter sp.]MDQ7997491.1 Gfo/Idh/MocA family oxidoreductase [Luteibacter sp.]MDQ8050045.1 Gfo/Idh/MocA family oxidoreductase [Luteibacter sp.]